MVLKLKSYEVEESGESVGGGSLGSMASDLSYNLEKGMGERRETEMEEGGWKGVVKMELKETEGEREWKEE